MCWSTRPHKHTPYYQHELFDEQTEVVVSPRKARRAAQTHTHRITSFLPLLASLSLGNCREERVRGRAFGRREAATERR
jgi:hypothetical protein